MLNLIQGQIDGASFVRVLLILVLIGYFLYKEWPEFKKRVTEGSKKAAQSEESDRQLTSRVDNVEKRLDQHQEMLSRDYKKLNALEDSVERSRKISTQTLEEMEIIMRAMLGVLDSLQELGADTASKQAQKEINDYLTKIAHKTPALREEETG